MVSVTSGSDGVLRWAVESQGQTVLMPSKIAIQADGRQLLADKPSLAKRDAADENIPTPFYRKATVRDRYSRMVVSFGSKASVEFRAYDDGAAYRIIPGKRKPFTVDSETAEFRFADDLQAIVPYVNDTRDGERYSFSFESYYDTQRLSEMFPDSLAITPFCLTLPDGRKAVVMDCGVEDYPGMMLTKGEGNSLSGVFAPYVIEQGAKGGGLNLHATKRAPYIAKCNGTKALPWRTLVIADSEKQLLDCDMAMRLAPACRVTDTSWIKPGKVAWDWWNNTNVWGVDFLSGMNTATYKHYIDFAQRNNLEYIIIDEGWSGRESLTDKLNIEVYIPELIEYGREHGVGIILWSSWRNMIGNDPIGGDDIMERYMAHYERIGIKGFKVDFFDRDDQQAIASVWRMAECAARHHLLLDLHGFRAIGVNRAYPNVLNYEGVKGLENSKWEPRDNNGPVHDQPRYDVTIPFLRMLAGPMDYTPGAMDNAFRDNFFGNNNHPMSQGTRCHQMAMYTIFEAPLQMLADSPTRYAKEQECTDFIAQIPTTFDETVPIAGEIGEYVAIARRKDSIWYVAAMTNWTPRQITLPLTFLREGTYTADIFADGPNAIAGKEAMDYSHTSRKVKRAESLKIAMAPGGGWTAIIKATE